MGAQPEDNRGGRSLALYIYSTAISAIATDRFDGQMSVWLCIFGRPRRSRSATYGTRTRPCENRTDLWWIGAEKVGICLTGTNHCPQATEAIDNKWELCAQER
jgi:hypothetical protein